MRQLYETDVFLTKFSATVTSCDTTKDGWAITLDRTAFYPEGGGQPSDTGTLNDAKISFVEWSEGEIVHHSNLPLAVGEEVTGQIDFDRRFDLMQQHSGEHIVSGFAHSLYGCENVGFHMGHDVITIDFDVVLTGENLAEIERSTNDYIWQNHPCVITYPDETELEQINYRSKKKLTGEVRIVSFPGADTCACCGTHVAASGQIGFVKLLSVHKFRDGVRVELLCGRRALQYLSQTLEQNRLVSQALSVKPLETGMGAQRLVDETEQLKLQVAKSEREQCAVVAQLYAGQGNVLYFSSERSADGVRRLADAILEVVTGWTACFAGDDSVGYKCAVGSRNEDVREQAKLLFAALNGRGGGQPHFVQGSVIAKRSDIEQYFAAQWDL